MCCKITNLIVIFIFWILTEHGNLCLRAESKRMVILMMRFSYLVHYLKYNHFHIHSPNSALTNSYSLSFPSSPPLFPSLPFYLSPTFYHSLPISAISLINVLCGIKTNAIVFYLKLLSLAYFLFSM